MKREEHRRSIRRRHSSVDGSKHPRRRARSEDRHPRRGHYESTYDQYRSYSPKRIRTYTRRKAKLAVSTSEFSDDLDVLYAEIRNKKTKDPEKREKLKKIEGKETVLLQTTTTQPAALWSKFDGRNSRAKSNEVKKQKTAAKKNEESLTREHERPREEAPFRRRLETTKITNPTRGYDEQFVDTSDDIQLLDPEMIELEELNQEPYGRKGNIRRRKNPAVKNRAFPEPLDQKNLFYAAGIIFAGVLSLACLGISFVAFWLIM